MKCTCCNTEAEHLTIAFDTSIFEKHYICDMCMEKGSEIKISLDEINWNLRHYKVMLTMLEELFKEYDMNMLNDSNPDSQNLMREALSIYKSTLNLQTKLKIRKMQLENETPEFEIYQQKMQEAVDAEDYEKAADIRDTINFLKLK